MFNARKNAIIAYRDGAKPETGKAPMSKLQKGCPSREEWGLRQLVQSPSPKILTMVYSPLLQRRPTDRRGSLNGTGAQGRFSSETRRHQRQGSLASRSSTSLPGDCTRER